IPPSLLRFAGHDNFQRLLATGAAEIPRSRAERTADNDRSAGAPEHPWQLGEARWLLPEGDNERETVALTLGGRLRRVRVPADSDLPDGFAQVRPVAVMAAELLRRRGEPNAPDAAVLLLDTDPARAAVDERLIMLQVIDGQVLVVERDPE